MSLYYLTLMRRSLDANMNDVGMNMKNVWNSVNNFNEIIFVNGIFSK